MIFVSGDKVIQWDESFQPGVLEQRGVCTHKERDLVVDTELTSVAQT